MHAEQNAIAKAARKGIPLEGSTFYITLSPCPDCCKLMVASGVKRVVYADEYSDLSGLDFLRSNGVEVTKYIEK